jgi:hypothetical protein
MTQERQYAVLFRAALLCARKMAERDSDKRDSKKLSDEERAINQAATILGRIDRRWSTKTQW